MNKIVSLSLLLLIGSEALQANDVSGSYFSVRPVNQQDIFGVQSAVVEQAGSIGRAVRQTGMTIQGFYSRSMRSDELARYFLFNNKTSLRVKEATPTTHLTEIGQDVLAANFNISTNAGTFDSTIEMAPRQATYGAQFNIRKYFHHDWWVALEVPVMHVSNDLNLTETVSVTGGKVATGNGIEGDAYVATIKDAFKQDGLKYGKIDGRQKLTRAGDIVVKFGYDCPKFNREDLYITTYGSVIVPAGNKATGEYMFEPIVGNGGHLALQFGTRGDVLREHSYKNGQIWYSWGIESQYLFKNTQKRSFDLYQNGPWSRYLPVYATAAQRTTGGVASATYAINLLTCDTEVTPGFSGRITTAINFVADKWYMGASYESHLMKAEKLKLADAWEHTEATIADYQFQAATTNRFRSIGTALVNDDETSAHATIKEADINLNSAAHPAAISHVISARIGRQNKCKKCPFQLELGGNLEFSRQNTALSRWGGWARVHGSF